MIVLIGLVLRVILVLMLIRFIAGIFGAGTDRKKPGTPKNRRKKSSRYDTKDKDVADGDYEEIP
jgi:hypothetical protein